MKAYPTYKPSGVEWLGEVPDHWKMRRLKTIFTLQKRPVRTDDEIVTAFRDGAVTLRKNRRVDGFTNALQEIGYQGVRQNDLVIHAMDGFAGAIGVSDSDGKSTPVYSVCTPNEGVLSSFYGLLLRHMALAGFVTALAKGVRERSTEFRWADASVLSLPLPPYSEQRAITAFLDREVAKIDGLIEEQRRLIALLAEKRQATISHAVTKGLNPHAKLKPSGIDWLGDVPEGWDVVRIKNLAELITKGTTPTTMGFDFVDEGIRFLKGENVNGAGFVSAEPEFFISDEANAALVRSQLQAGDVLVVIAGATTGKSAVISEALLPANTNQAVAFVRCRSLGDAAWIQSWLSTQAVQNIIMLGSVQSAQPNLSMEDLGNLPILIAPEEERAKILDYCDGEDSSFSELSMSASSAITLLQERRSALISAAVTGKIDVRDLAPDMMEPA